MPRIVKLPEPPAGPRIKRVLHDAGLAKTPGEEVHITVGADPGLEVTASIGRILERIPCAADASDAEIYRCAAPIPAGAGGSHRLQVRATGKDGRVTTLSSAYPVAVTPPDPEAELNRLNVRLQAIFFERGSHALDDADRGALRTDAEFLKAHPNLPIHVEGHGDSDEGDAAEALSARRANEALDELVRLGVPRERMTSVAFGASRPVSSSRNEEERALNRRVLILLAQPGSVGQPR